MSMKLQIAPTDQPHVLIIGGGFGGVAAAKALAPTGAKISLIDKANHHVFQPLLYQVATSALTSTDIATPLRRIFRKQTNVTVFLGEVTSLNLQSRTFAIEGENVPFVYDYLIVATGAQQSYFGHDEFAAFAPGLKSLSDAEYLRNKILSAFENAERKLDPPAHPEMITFVLVGGGPTGVELSAAIADMARRTLASEYRRYNPTKLRVILVQSGPTILPQFPAQLSAKALRRLEDLGVEVRVNSRVTGVDAEGITIGEERIASKTVIWTAGVAANSLVQSLGLPADRGGRVTVQGDCSVASHPEVFIIGDAASFSEPGAKPLPGVAQVAIQQGAYVGHLIGRKIAGGAAPAPFRYFDKGNLAVIGPFFAVIDSFHVRSAGRLAFVIWAFIHIQFLSSVLNQLDTMSRWLWFILTNQRVGRLIIHPKREDPTSDHVL
jgi:NADH dehydrogenase